MIFSRSMGKGINSLLLNVPKNLIMKLIFKGDGNQEYSMR